MEMMILYITIFLIKTIGGGFANYRLILMKEGNKSLSMLIGLFASLCWVLSMGLIVDNVFENFLVIIPFVLGVVVGNYIGVFLDKYIKSGNILTTIIISEENEELINILKREGFEVNSFPAKGKDNNKKLVMIKNSRKTHKNLIEKIKEAEFSNFIINEKIEEVF
jgi:uncharacterized protein YebE (UPF0316 family)